MQIISELAKLGFTDATQIGAGGYGTIYAVQWMKYPGKTYVAKIIYKENDRATKSFNSEHKALRHLFDDNIINYYHSYNMEKYYILIYEFCPHHTLIEYVSQRGSLSTSEFRIVIMQIIKAIQKCHHAKIAHRDIKPGNIFIDENNRMKLADFGLAEELEAGEMAKDYVGTKSFMAPEIFNKRPYDPFKADIWALGVTCFYMVTGKLPFVGDYYYPVEFHIKNKDAILPLGISSDVYSFIMPMLRKNPMERPSIDEIIIHPFLEGSCLPSLLYRNKTTPVFQINKKKLTVSRQIVSRSIKYLHPLLIKA